MNGNDIHEHIREHAALGYYGAGGLVLPVDAGGSGKFLTIGDALDYIATQPTMELVATTAVIDCNQWDNFSPLVSGSLADSRPGDFLFLDNDDPGVDAWQSDNHYYRIISAIDNATESAPGVYLESGILGTTQAGYTAKIYRPSKFNIQCLSGDHTASGTMPDGYSITISGNGRETTIGGSGIAMPRYGFTEFTNFIQTAALTTFDDRTTSVPLGLLDGGFSCVSMRDMWCEGENVIVLGDQVFQSVRMKNIPCSGFKGHRFYAFIHNDFTDIDNVTFDTITSMELAEIFTSPRRCSTSHKKIVRNCRFRRSQDVSAMTGGTISQFNCVTDPIVTGMPAFEMDFIDCSFVEDGLKIQADNLGVFQFADHTNASSKGTHFRFINSEVLNIDSHNVDFAINPGGFTVNATLLLEFINTKGVDNDQITSNLKSLTDNAILRYRDNDAYQELTYQAGLITAPELGRHILVGQLTGNTLMLNPVGKKGEQIYYSFEQDVTGSRTITWSSAYKVHANPVGGASQKAVFSFMYDGAHWVQENTTAWA